MSLIGYYTGILALRKPGVPTVREARQDFQALLHARLGTLPYV
jgi:hypothetical protein